MNVRRLYVLMMLCLLSGLLGTPSGAALSWKPLKDVLGSVQKQLVICMAINNAGQIFAASNTSIEFSSNGGAAWQVVRFNIPNERIRHIGFNASGQPVISAVGSVIGIYHLAKGQWTLSQGIGATSSISEFTYDNAGNMYVCTGWAGNVYKSADGGVTFSMAASSVGSTQSYSRGALWTICSDNAQNILYCGGELPGGLYQSTDGGVNWTQCGCDSTTSKGNIFAVATNLLGNPVVARTSIATGLPVQTQTAAGWIPAEGLAPWSYVGGLLSTPSGAIFAIDCVAGNYSVSGAYISYDGGLTFSIVNAGLPAITPLMLNRDASGHIYLLAFNQTNSSTGLYVLNTRF